MTLKKHVARSAIATCPSGVKGSGAAGCDCGNLSVVSQAAEVVDLVTHL